MKNQFSPKVKFIPWVGCNYKNSQKGTKVLVLGESIYCCQPYTCANPLCCNQVIDIVTKQIEVKEKNRYYTSVAKLCSKYITFNLSEKIYFWNSVAFYEFVQVSVGTKQQQRPTQEMWEAAKEPFLEVYNELLPDVVYVTGKELSQNFLNNFESILVHRNFNTFFDCHLINIGGKWVKIISFYHPAYYKKFTITIRPDLLRLTESSIEDLLKNQI